MARKAEDIYSPALYRESWPTPALEGQRVLEILDQIKMKCMPGKKKGRRQRWEEEKGEKQGKEEKGGEKRERKWW